MRSRAWSAALLALPVLGWMPALSLAGDLPARFTLGRYIPADVWLYMHRVHNPERAWIEQQWGEVFEAFHKSGIDRDVFELFLTLLSDEEQRADAEALLEKAGSLIQGVRWRDLIHEEVVFVERMGSTGFAPPEYMCLVRGAPGSAGKNIEGLVAILKEIASLSDELSVARSQQDGADLWLLEVPNKKLKKKKMNLGFSLFRKGDVIGMSFGKQIMQEALGLMAGKKDTPAIAAHPRFRQAIAQVKPPNDALTYFDMKLFLGNLKGCCKQVCSEDSKLADDERKKARMIHKVLQQVDMVDFILTTVQTQGRRETTHELVRLQPDKANLPLARAFLKRKAFAQFDRYLPANTTGFSLTALIDMEQVYTAVIKFVEKEVPDGAAHVKQWESKLASVGFDPYEDLFSWFSGEMITVQMPAAVVTPMGGADWVQMIRVKDPKLASEKVNAAIDFIRGKLQRQGQTLMVSPAQVQAEGFRQVTHPFLMMFLRPVVGVKDEWLMIGSSAGAVNKCLDVAAGEAPSIRRNERFQAEGLIPDGPAQAVSFSDISKLGQELGARVGMVGMIGGMMSAAIPPDNPEAAKAKAVLQKVMGIVMKLGPVLQKLDFFNSKASVSTYDGASAFRTKSVVTYRAPSPDEIKTASATAE
ncbi:MAG: DUF3352 domain-containing protein [Planctomycetes bacterium]|nr:DUF3352 domain-containing protein [Planctomycetota bacterium]